MSRAFRETVKVPSIDKGVNLDVWMYKPSGSGPYPVVIAGHGMTATKEAGLDTFAEAWADSAGFASLIMDYRFFGDSDGEPRNLFSLAKQLEDYKSVIKWARERPSVFRNEKIVVMGCAAAGVNVANLLLEDPGLAGGMGQCPLLDGYTTLMSLPFSPRLTFWAVVDYIRGILGLSPVFIPAVGAVGTFALLTTPSSEPGFQAMLAPMNKTLADTLNVVPARSIFEFMGARAGRQLKNTHSRYLIVLAQDDDIFSVQIAHEVADAAGPEKVAIVEAQAGHYEMMKGGKGFETNINAQLSFLRELL